MSIAVLVPVCSRSHTWNSFEECFLVTRFLRGFNATKDPEASYTIYIGVDDDDTFFLDHQTELETIGKVVLLSGCQHAPAWAWNKLAESAWNDGHEYMFQIGDDVLLETPGWTCKFIEKLKETHNRGVVGPKHPANFELRRGKTQVIENAFVHRSHYTLFQSFFHPTIRNWHCDEWLTQIYTGICSYTFEDILVDNGCIDKRYTIESVNIRDRIQEGRAKVRADLRGCFSFCLYGPYTDKYYKGLQENVVLIRKYYPKCDIRVYSSPEAVPFVEILGVTCCPTPEIGSRNMSYRFLPVFSGDYEFVCIRDSDSRIHARDRWCIDWFLDSQYKAYTIRDHAYHAYKIMGGLWGCKGRIDIPESVLHGFIRGCPNGYAVDTRFLDSSIYPIVRDKFIVFSHSPNGILKDPTETIQIIEHRVVDNEFCGNVVLYKDDVPYHQFTHM